MVENLRIEPCLGHSVSTKRGQICTFHQFVLYNQYIVCSRRPPSGPGSSVTSSDSTYTGYIGQAWLRVYSRAVVNDVVVLLTNQKPPFSRASFFSFESWPGNCFAGVRSRAVHWGASWTFAPACLHCTVISNGKKPLKKSSTKVIFTSFSLQVSVNLHNFRFRLPALHIQNLWNRCIHTLRCQLNE